MRSAATHLASLRRKKIPRTYSDSKIDVQPDYGSRHQFWEDILNARPLRYDSLKGCRTPKTWLCRTAQQALRIPWHSGTVASVIDCISCLDLGRHSLHLVEDKIIDEIPDNIPSAHDADKEDIIPKVHRICNEWIRTSDTFLIPATEKVKLTLDEPKCNKQADCTYYQCQTQGSFHKVECHDEHEYTNDERTGMHCH